MEEGKKKEDKGFGEGIEVVKAEPEEEKDIEINFGKVLSFFKKKESEPHTAATTEHKKGHKSEQHDLLNKNVAGEATSFGSSRSKVNQETGHHSSSKGKEEEAEIDIWKFASGVKGLFRGKKEALEVREGEKAAAKEGSDDEVSLNPKSIIEFFNKRGATLLLIIGILISVGLTANVRYQVNHLHFTEDWARNSVYNTIQSDIQNAISSQYPNLPDARKSQILAEEMEKARNGKTYVFKSAPYTGQSIELKNQVKGTAEFIKDYYRDGNGQAYSPDIDPYYWNRYAKNVLEKGRIGDEVRNGLQWDTYQLAPQGRPIAAQDTFFPHFLAYLYKFVRFFSHSATLWSVQTIAYPMLINSLTVLMIFLMGRKIAGNVGGFFGSLMAGLHSAYVSRTIHGDNDAFVMFFAILTLWLFVEAVYARKKMMRLALPALAGLSAGLFSLVWGGWWFMFIFILAAAAAAIALGIAKSAWQSMTSSHSGAMNFKGLIKSASMANVVKLFVLPTAIFFVTTGVFVALFNGVDRFLATPLLAFGVTKLKTAVLEASYWPNVLTTVAELNPGNFNQVLSSIRPSIFWLSALSAAMMASVGALNMFFTAVNSKLGNKLKSVSPDESKALYYVFFATLMMVWFLGTIYASSKGIRFVVMLAPAVGLGFGITIGLIFRFACWINDNFLKINKMAAALVVFLVLATAVYSTDIVKNAYSIARNDVPIMNDAWYDSLTAIREDSNSTTKDAIITSWWDFGHHFKAIADRRVTFDGTTQQGPQAHWVGRFFMTEDETEAAGILRMLDCGSDSGFNALNSVKKDFAESIKIIARINKVPSKEEAESILAQDYRLTGEQATNVTQYTHCSPPEGYVIASEDMIGKSGVWGHFGSWDFEKGIIWQTLRGKNQKEAAESMMKMFNYSEEKAKAVYNDMRRVKNDAEANSWIAPWPSFSGDLSGCQLLVRVEDSNSTGNSEKNRAEEKIVTCGSGLVVNLTTNDAYFPLPDGKVLYPVSFVYLTNETGTEKIAKKTYANDTVPQRFSVILVPQGNSYYSAVSSPEQAAGMFTQMFFYEGRGLKHFKLLTHNRGLTGTNVYVYKAQWDTLK